jgi:hypothetical protein
MILIRMMVLSTTHSCRTLTLSRDYVDKKVRLYGKVE